MFTVKCGAIPNHTRVHKSPLKEFSRMSLSNSMSCLASFRILGTHSRFVQLYQLGFINKKRMKFTPPHLLRKHVIVCIELSSRLYLRTHLYVVLAVKVMSDYAAKNGSGSDVRTA